MIHRTRETKKKVVFRSLVFSYVLMLLFPLAFGCGVFAVSLHAAGTQLKELNRASAAQAQSIVDGYLTQANELSQLIIAHNVTKSLRYYPSPFSAQKLQLVKQLQKDMIRQLSANKAVVNMYLYFPLNEAVLSNTNLYYQDDFSLQCENDLWMSYDTWRKALDFRGYRKHLLLSRRDASGTVQYKMILMQKSSTAPAGVPADVVAVCVLDIEHIRAVLAALSDDGLFQTDIIDAHTETVLPGGSGAALPLGTYRAQMERPSDSALSSLLLYRRPVITFAPSQAEDWIYAFVTPARKYFGPVVEVLTAMAFYLAVLLLGGAALAFFQARRQYTPLEGLIDQIRGRLESGARDGDLSSGNSSEYEQIKQTLVHLLDQKKLHEQQLTHSRDIVRDNVLRNLFKGRVGRGETITSLAEQYGFHFLSQEFLVLAYFLEDSNDFPQDHNAGDEETLELIYSIVSSVAEQSAQDGWPRYTAELNDTVACLVCLPPGASQSPELFGRISLLAAKSQTFLRERLGCVLSIGISAAHLGLSQIGVAYAQAVEAAKYAAILGCGGQIAQYAALSPGDREPALSQVISKERMFLNCMKAEDYLGAQSLMDEIIEGYFAQDACSLQQAKLRLSGLINAAVTAFEEIRPQVGESFFEEVNPIDRFYDSKTVAALNENAHQIFGRLVAVTDTRKRESLSERNQRILEYVRCNYRDNALNITAVSKEFDMTPSYLSSLFRQATGRGLLDFIHLLRIEEAKRLMREQENLTVREVAAQVGYCSSLTMVRAFRRYEGVTPSAYKEKLQKA